MGMDMTMDIVRKNGEIVAGDIYPGRSTEWFHNMMGRGNDYEYNELPIDHNAPEGVMFNEKARSEDGYFNFRYINVGKYYDWFNEYRPDLDAGWATTYDKWRIESKGYKPEYLPRTLAEAEVDEEMISDMHFIVYEKEFDGATWLYDYIMKYDWKDREELWIRYCFDN